MVRSPCCDKLNVKKGLWTAEEDAKILAYVAKHGTGNWTAVPKRAGLQRCGKSCRLRWTNYLRPDLKHESFTPQEEEMIVRLHAAIGSRWSIIAQQLPGRTDNDVKNYWNTRLRKKLSEMGIDPVTHKPFSKILADYGNIGGLLKSGSCRIGSLSRDLKNALITSEVPQQQYPLPLEGISNINCHLMVPPKVEPIRECFLNNNSISNHSLDLLDQLQAIKLVTEASSTCTEYRTASSPYTPSEVSLSSVASSTCSSSTAALENMTTGFSWCDFLLEDEFFPSDPVLEEENIAARFSSMNQTQDITTGTGDQTLMIPHGDGINCEVTNNVGIFMDLTVETKDDQVLSSSSQQSSFVETILKEENRILLEFPILLEESFYY